MTLLETGPWTWGWEALVALGTIGLAVGTFMLALAARREAGEVKKSTQAIAKQAESVSAQVSLQRAQMAESLRAVVYPIAPAAWVSGRGEYQNTQMHVLPLQNGGPGVALNIIGKIWWHRQAIAMARQIYGGNIGPGVTSDAVMSTMPPDGGWVDGDGYLLYSDLTGTTWITRFRLRGGMQNHLTIESDPPGPAPDQYELTGQYPPPHWNALSTSES